MARQRTCGGLPFKRVKREFELIGFVCSPPISNHETARHTPKFEGLEKPAILEPQAFVLCAHIVRNGGHHTIAFNMVFDKAIADSYAARCQVFAFLCVVLCSSNDGTLLSQPEMLMVKKSFNSFLEIAKRMDQLDMFFMCT